MTLTTALLLAVCSARCAGFEHVQVQLPATATGFDPFDPATKTAYLGALGLPSQTSVQKFGANAGLNGGMWLLADPSDQIDDMLLKLRKPDSEGIGLTEAEQLLALSREYPALAHDEDLAFPLKIATCVGAGGQTVGDLILMRKVPGDMLAVRMSEYYEEGEATREQLYAVFGTVGKKLRAFHERYGMQHSDFHTANIIVSKAMSVDDHRVTFVDLAGIGADVFDDDLSHFADSLKLLEKYYHKGHYLEVAHKYFLRGYKDLPQPARKLPPAPKASAQKARAEAIRVGEPITVTAPFKFTTADEEDDSFITLRAFLAFAVSSAVVLLFKLRNASPGSAGARAPSPLQRVRSLILGPHFGSAGVLLFCRPTPAHTSEAPGAATAVPPGPPGPPGPSGPPGPPLNVQPAAQLAGGNAGARLWERRRAARARSPVSRKALPDHSPGQGAASATH